jgi:hypothetical protein
MSTAQKLSGNRPSTWKTTAKQLQRNLKKLLGPSLKGDLPFARELNEFKVRDGVIERPAPRKFRMPMFTSRARCDQALQDALEQEEAAERNEISTAVTEAKAAVAEVRQCLEGLEPGGEADVQILQVLTIRACCF